MLFVSELNLTADELVAVLLDLEASAQLALLDSCGRELGNSRYLIAGIYPTESFEFNCQNQTEAFAVLQFLDEKLAFYKTKSEVGNFHGGICIATIAYEFGLLLENLNPRAKEIRQFEEPSATFSFYKSFVIHDYALGKTFVVSEDEKKLAKLLDGKRSSLQANSKFNLAPPAPNAVPLLPNWVASNLTKNQYLAAVAEIKRRIRLGDIYQANLTQRLRAELPKDSTPENIFWRLRRHHPAPFAAFIKRKNDCVISASPERFLKVETQIQESRIQNPKSKIVIASPIKGTRLRGANAADNLKMRRELETSLKDRAENTMIVDLLRNDIGRVCEFGSVKPVRLCEIEEHETLFHLVSTIEGRLRENAKFGDLLRATFPCGSITGAPKISAMQILDEIETAPRNLSMGAIGYFGFDGSMDLNVAIRTMVVRDKTASFNVGGGIVFDSQPVAEYEESLIKAKALLAAFNVQKAA